MAGSKLSGWGCGSLWSLPRAGKRPRRLRGLWPQTKDVITDMLSIHPLFSCEGSANEAIGYTSLVQYSFCRGRVQCGDRERQRDRMGPKDSKLQEWAQRALGKIGEKCE